MKKITSSAAKTGNVTKLMGGVEVPKSTMTFEEYSTSNKVVGYKEAVIVPTQTQRNILAADTVTDNDMIGFIPVRDLSYLSLNFEPSEVETKAQHKYKDLVEKVAFIKEGSPKDKTRVLVAYLNKDKVFTSSEDTSIFGRSNILLDNLTNKEEVLRLFGGVLIKEKGFCYDSEGKLFVYLDLAKVMAEVILPTIITIDDQSIDIKNMANVIKERAPKVMEVSDASVDENHVYVAIVYKNNQESDLIMKVSTKIFTYMNISAKPENFQKMLMDKISFYTTGANKESRELDVQWVDILSIISSMDKSSSKYQQIVKLMGADGGNITIVPIIRYTGSFIKSEDDRSDIFGRSNKASEFYKGDKLLSDKFWSNLTSYTIESFSKNGKVYFLPDFRKVAIFTYFGGGSAISPLAVGKSFNMNIQTSKDAVAFAIHI